MIAMTMKKAMMKIVKMQRDRLRKRGREEGHQKRK